MAPSIAAGAGMKDRTIVVESLFENLRDDRQAHPATCWHPNAVIEQTGKIAELHALLR